MAIHDYNNPQHFPERKGRLDMELKEVVITLVSLEKHIEECESYITKNIILEALQTAISHLEALQEEKQLRIKYQDIVYQRIWGGNMTNAAKWKEFVEWWEGYRREYCNPRDAFKIDCKIHELQKGDNAKQ